MPCLRVKRIFKGVATLTIDGKDVPYAFESGLTQEEFKDACKAFADSFRAQRDLDSASLASLVGQEII